MRTPFCDAGDASPAPILRDARQPSDLSAIPETNAGLPAGDLRRQPELRPGSADASEHLVDDHGTEVSEASSLSPNKTFLLNGIAYQTDDRGKIYSIDGKRLPNCEFYKNGRLCQTDAGGAIRSIDGGSVERLQQTADRAAQDYNAKFTPFDRAVCKGVDGVRRTENGGVSFSASDSIFRTENGRPAVVKLEATGSRNSDFDAANAALGLAQEPDGYVWHHVDDYDVKENTITLELVRDEAHNASKPHSGGCAQFDAVYGPSYNPPRKGAE